MGVGRRLAGTWLDNRKSALTQTFASTADGLRRLGNQYNDQPNIRSYIEAAADGLETVSQELSNQRFEDIAQQAEEFSRNYPVTVFAGAIAAGVVISRILRTAAESGNGGDSGGERSQSATRGGKAAGRSRSGEANP
jgi:hypothetical protein